jgi:hypothetical protein
MVYFFGWLVFSFVAGFVGSDRKIGFWGAFLLSLILSPLVGLIVAFASKTDKDEKYQEEILKTQKQQQTTLEQMAQTNEIEQLFNLMKKGILTEEEFNQKKKALLGLDNSLSQIENPFGFDNTTIETLTSIKANPEKGVLLESIFEFLKTYSISRELQMTYPKIAEDLSNDRYNLKPFEAILKKHKEQPEELLKVQQQMKEFIK